MSEIDAFARRVRAALPFWAERGVDGRGGFYESLDLDGRPNTNDARRTRVAFRQIYVFSAASLAGDIDGAEIADRGLAEIEARAWARCGAPGWAHRTGADGTVVDPRRDAYDHAFAVLALAYARKAAPSERADRLFAETLALLDGPFAHPAGGVRETLDAAAALRRQNPHMHLFEAYLAAYALSGDPTLLARADALLALFRTRFFAEGRLTEYFADDLSAAPAADRSRLEPGHQAEWIWLLRRRAGLAPLPDGADVDAACDALWRGARAGERALGGVLCDETNTAGEPVRTTCRLWVQTEYLKAAIAEREAGRADAGAAAESAARAINRRYLDPAPEHCWIDRIDAEGAASAATVPASTLYHLYCAASEVSAASSDMRSATNAS